jgi:hypothetical protein
MIALLILGGAVMFGCSIACALRDSQDGQDACGPTPSMGEPVPDDEVAE